MTHICVGDLTIIGPDNGLSPGRRQAIIWTNAGILLIGPALVSKGQISIWHICLILKLALYKYHIIIIIIMRNKLQWNFNRYSYIFIQEN